MKASQLLVVLVMGPYIPTIVAIAIKEKCKRNDPNLDVCTVNNLNKIVDEIMSGSKDVGIPVLDPFEIKKLALSDKSSQGLSLELEVNDAIVKGMKSAKFLEGSKFDLQKGKMVVKLSIADVMMEGNYKIDGKVLLLPIKGSGKVNVSVGDLIADFTADVTIEKKDGTEYMKITNPGLDFTNERFFIKMTNLFNGDKTLGDNMNTFLNENWREVVTSFKPVLNQTIKEIVYTIVSNILGRIPYDDLYPK